MLSIQNMIALLDNYQILARMESTITIFVSTKN